MTSMFKPATKEKLRARIALDGPAGSGKTYTALRFARALAGPTGKIAVIDTEHRSASKYAGEIADGDDAGGFAFDVCELSHYSPSTYTNVIREAGKTGYDVIVIDSLSHAWEGVGGALDTVDRKASNKGGSFSAWKDVTPLHREMMDAMLSSPCHVIVTMRTKTAYEVGEIERNGKRKMTVEKVGTKPVQREGMEYEFDLVADLDLEHILTVSKTRCSAMDGCRCERPGPAFIAPFAAWLNAGAEPAKTEPTKKGVKLSGQSKSEPAADVDTNPKCGQHMAERVKQLAEQLQVPPDKIREIVSRCGVTKLADMPFVEGEKLIQKLEARLQEQDVPF